MAKTVKKRGLGKGLEAILSSNTTPETAEDRVHISEIPVAQIERNPYQPREEFDETALKELAASIEVHGIIQPLTLRKLAKNSYQLIAGERRLRASKMAGLESVPAYIRTANDEGMLEMGLIENIQREDLNPVEIALSYQRMIDELKLKQSDLGKKVGKNRASVANYLRILKLPPEILTALRTRSISFGHGRALINIDNENLQIQIYQKILSSGLSVRQVEQLAREAMTPLKKPGTSTRTIQGKNDIHLKEVARSLQDKLGSKVGLNQKTTGEGEITISFSSTDDLNRILELLDF